MDYVYFSYAMDADVKKKLELIAGPRGLNILLRKISEEWVNEHYPDQAAILVKKRYLNKEIDKLDRYLDNMSQVEATQGMDVRMRKQFLEDKEDNVIGMLFITYITKRADNLFHQKWNDILEFSSIPELKIFLKHKWKEYGRDEVIRLNYKYQFINKRIKDIKHSSESYQITLKEYIEEHNIDIEDEYENGKALGSKYYFDEYLKQSRLS